MGTDRHEWNYAPRGRASRCASSKGLLGLRQAERRQSQNQTENQHRPQRIVKKLSHTCSSVFLQQLSMRDAVKNAHRDIGNWIIVFVFKLPLAMDRAI